MVNLIKKLFIKDYNNTGDAKVRTRYGITAGVIGIVANFFLFSAKLIAGILSLSIAVIADAVNNLSDFMTSIVTIVGFKLSGQPADKEHPYGHARYEYITGLIVAFIIFFIGVETGRSALDKIIAGSPADFSTLTCIILACAIFVKILLAVIFKGLGDCINSDAITAMSKDSRNDVISTAVVLICAIIGATTNFAIDGYLGIAVSVFVLISAVKLIIETINPLLGTAPDKELIDNIEKKLKNYPGVLDIHDLIVHSYGPTKTFATVHIEVDCSVDIMISHDLADNIERDFAKNMNIRLVCHIDPVKVNDPETDRLRNKITTALIEKYPYIRLHDFRIVGGKSHTNVIFDVVIPFDTPKSVYAEIRALVDETLSCKDKTYYAVIEFENSISG